MVMSVKIEGRGGRGAAKVRCKFLPLYTSKLLLDRISQKHLSDIMRYITEIKKNYNSYEGE
jgi:hypothetical protein